MPEETVVGASWVWGWLADWGAPKGANPLPKPCDCGADPNSPPPAPLAPMPPKLRPAAEDCGVPKPPKPLGGVCCAPNRDAADDCGVPKPKPAADDWGAPKPPKPAEEDCGVPNPE